MRKTLRVLACSAMVFGLAAQAQSAETGFTAKIFDKDSNKQKVLFNYKNESEIKGDRRIATNTFTDLDGKVAAVEITEFIKTGDTEKVASYSISQKQLGSEGKVEVKDGKAEFSYTIDGKTKTDSEKATDEFVVGPAIPGKIKANWETLNKGGKVKIRLAVLDRQETVGFEISKVGEGDYEGQKAVVLRMKPSSFIIAQIVNPLHFHMTADGQRVLQVDGRTQVKLKDGKKWKDLDAVTVYKYKD